jgi:hypothetical protein
LFLKAADSPISKTSFAHAGDVTEVCDTTAYEKETPAPFRRFICPKPNAGQAAATKAVQRADRKTSYGSYPSSRNAPIGGATNANRYSGMVTTASLDAIPFEISALVRLLKWVEKSQQGLPLSANRGITCCTFISACYQTAFMSKYLETIYVTPQMLQKANALLQKELESKQQVHKRNKLKELQTKTGIPLTKPGNDKSTYRVGQALRDNSNRLPMENSPLKELSLEGQWAYIQDELFGVGSYVKKMTLDKIIPPFVFYDVKYMNTKLLETALIGANWKYSDYDKY